ncbi:hypothetical protein [Microseira sp. BLCC-F43]|jgi:hypothetical protein|uniref:hypothetical protein n=1 Tax=Microseira sp. BLCC-F43 TaxID=3153602 RepID=UPI0035BA5B1F
MQKLVTIYLDREGYRILGKRSPEQSHGIVQEHLEDYLAAGWEIKSIAGGGAGAGEGTGSIGCTWVVVLLEKP